MIHYFVLLICFIYIYICSLCFNAKWFYQINCITSVSINSKIPAISSISEPMAQVSYCRSAASVVRPSSIRKLSHFQPILQNRLMDFDKTRNKVSLMKIYLTLLRKTFLYYAKLNYAKLCYMKSIFSTKIESTSFSFSIKNYNIFIYIPIYVEYRWNTRKNYMRKQLYI